MTRICAKRAMNQSLRWKLIGSTFLSLCSSLYRWSDVNWGIRWNERGRGLNGNRKDETRSRSTPPFLPSSCFTFQAWGDVFQSMVKWTLFKCWWNNFQFSIFNWKIEKTKPGHVQHPLLTTHSRAAKESLSSNKRKLLHQHSNSEHLTIDCKTSFDFNNSLHHWLS